MASGWSHQNTQHLSIKFIISYGHGSWHPKTMAKSHQGSLITDHHNGYSHAAKVWNIQRITKMWHREVKWANAVGKMVPVDLLHAKLPQTISFKEKTQYLWSTAKWSLRPLTVQASPAQVWTVRQGFLGRNGIVTSALSCLFWRCCLFPLCQSYASLPLALAGIVPLDSSSGSLLL